MTSDNNPSANAFKLLQAERDKLDEALRSVIADFEERTGCKVESICLSRVSCGARHPALTGVETEVKL